MRVSCIEAAGMSAIASGSSRHCTRQMALSGVIQAERRIPIAQVRQGGRVRLYHQSLSVRIAEHASISNKRLYTSIDDLKPGANVTLAGWLIQIRPVSKYLAFAVLLLPRGKGQVQLIIRDENETTVADVTDVWQAAGLHGVIEVEGVFSQRPESAQKNQDPFSCYELQVERCMLINAVTTSGLPFNPTDVGRSTKEEVRLRNRHLDLRNPERGDRIRLRSRVTWAIRSFLHANQFDEIETPTLLRSTPEGAREYLVPTRLSTSKVNKTDVDDPSTSDAQPKFFALQQSPQQPKQLLVISGVTDRYFQIARCFRDEDGRKDRQPEFTQVDMEMSFVSGEADPRHADWTLGGREVGNQVEGLIRAVWQSAGLQGTMTDAPFRVMTYEQAMTRFGSDKPDLRFDAEIVQVGQHLRAASEASGVEGEDAEQQEVDLLYFTLPDAGLTKKDVEAIVSQHAPLETEVFWGQREAENEMTKLLLRKSSLLRTFLNAHEIQASDVSVDKLKGFLSDAAVRGLPAADVDAYKPGDRTCVVLSSRQARSQGGSTVVGDVRRALLNELMARRLLKSSTPFQFAWIIEFPLFTRADEDKNVLSKGRWNSSHHPFTSPKSEDVKRMKEILRDHQAGTPFSQHDQHFLSNVKGQHYDLVLNGMEIGGGSVRIHDAELQRNVLRNVLELNEGELSRFDHLLRALQHGAPPHAGIALGLDRLMAVISDAPTIRDVIAFPKSAQGTDLLFGSPDAISSPSDDDVFAKTTSTDEVLQRYGLRRA